MRSFLLLAVLALAFVAVSAKTFHPHGFHSQWTKGVRASPAAEMTMQVAVKQDAHGLVTLKNFVDTVSDPKSPLYGKFATKKQLDTMLNDNMAISATLDYLKRHGAKNIHVQGSWIKATMQAKTVEHLFSAHAYHYTNKHSGKKAVKVHTYTLPADLKQHVDFIGYINYFPSHKNRLVIRSHGDKKTGKKQVSPNGTVTPALLNQVYGITTNTIDNAGVSHGCFEDGQDIDPADLTSFQQSYGLPAQNLTRIVGPNDPTACSADPNNCVEALLDFEYLMAVAQGAPTTFWAMDPNDQHPFMDWLINMTSDPQAPIVNSVSYGEVEQQVPSDVTARFEQAIQQVNARGISVIVSSGDDGVANFPARTDPTQCGFFPSYPASSPYVTAVGATQGPESGTPEVACSSATGGVITSGGGFSTVWAMPDYQAGAVNAYLQSNAGSTLPPTNQFNSSGRGYPDIALLGYNYEMVVGGQTIPVSGTSASAPVFAGIISLVVNQRMNAGKGALGFLNPALYQFASSNPAIFNDITQGENNCCASNEPQTCCQYGFTAVKGWDPITGLGSVNFAQLAQAFMALP